VSSPLEKSEKVGNPSIERVRSVTQVRRPTLRNREIVDEAAGMASSDYVVGISAAAVF
jgi:hypothetical protein